ncbi:hypothetical protein Dimus_038660 [Dionaea muscipula]
MTTRHAWQLGCPHVRGEEATARRLRRARSSPASSCSKLAIFSLGSEMSARRRRRLAARRSCSLTAVRCSPARGRSSLLARLRGLPEVVGASLLAITLLLGDEVR